MSTETEHYNLPIPDDTPEAGQSGYAALLAIRNALIAIDGLVHGQAGAIAGKAGNDKTWQVADIDGLAEALAGKMAAGRTFALGELTDTAGIADALAGYVLARMPDGKWSPASAQSVIGAHGHLVSEIQGLADALADRPLASAVAAALASRLPRDGSSAMTGDLDMGGKKLLNADWSETPVGLAAVPIGAVLFDPLGLGWPGFLEADGSSFDVEVYPDLAELYPAGILPDFTDRVPRGAGSLAGAAGTTQDDAMQRITGSVGRYYNITALISSTALLDGVFVELPNAPGNTAVPMQTSNATGRTLGFDSGNSPGARVSDDETRVKAIIGKWYIKAYGAFTSAGEADLVAIEEAQQHMVRSDEQILSPEKKAQVRENLDVARAGVRIPAIATTSGTAFDWTTIDPGATEITLDLSEVGLSGSDIIIVQLGTADGLVATGYNHILSTVVSGSYGFVIGEAGFSVGGGAANRLGNGILRLRRLDGSDIWAASYAGGRNVPNISLHGGGSVSLDAPVTQVRLTRSGTNTFVSGIAGLEYRT